MELNTLLISFTLPSTLTQERFSWAFGGNLRSSKKRFEWVVKRNLRKGYIEIMVTIQELQDLTNRLNDQVDTYVIVSTNDDWDHEFIINGCVIAYLTGDGRLYQMNDYYEKVFISLEDLTKQVTQ